MCYQSVITTCFLVSQVSLLFRSSATAVSLFSAYRSNRYYGFSMSFNVTLRSDVTTSTVQTALRLLKSYRRFGVSYLRYESESRGIRAFMPSSVCVCVCVCVTVCAPCLYYSLLMSLLSKKAPPCCLLCMCVS